MAKEAQKIKIKSLRAFKVFQYIAAPFGPMGGVILAVFGFFILFVASLYVISLLVTKTMFEPGPWIYLADVVFLLIVGGMFFSNRVKAKIGEAWKVLSKSTW